MQIYKFDNLNRYSANSIPMRARKTTPAIIKDFHNFMRSNQLIINAKLTPMGNGEFYYDIELSKPTLYGTTPITDETGYAMSATGSNLNEAIVDMATKYKGQNAYLNTGSVQHCKMPSFFA